MLLFHDMKWHFILLAVRLLTVTSRQFLPGGTKYVSLTKKEKNISRETGGNLAPRVLHSTKKEFTLKLHCHISIHLQQAPQDDRSPDRGGAPDLQCKNIKRPSVIFVQNWSNKTEKRKRHRHSHIQYLFLNCNVRTFFCSSCFYYSPLSSSSSFSISYYSYHPRSWEMKLRKERCFWNIRQMLGSFQKPFSGVSRSPGTKSGSGKSGTAS